MSYCSNSASSANRKSKIFKLNLDGNVYCHHEIVAVVRVVGRNNQRNGQEFYGCSKWHLTVNSSCGKKMLTICSNLIQMAV
ncbi:hypothetical protein Hanom_Chr10g00894401 [Helianthus anomalus]